MSTERATVAAGAYFVQLSSDLGRSWCGPITVHPSGASSPRIQKLKDGTLLVACDVSGHLVIVFYDSTDVGKTWTNRRLLDSRNTASGRPKLWVPGRVVELPDNSWMLPTSWYGGMEGLENVERLEFYRSSDRGLTWKFHSNLLAYPPHNISEPSVVTLPDGAMVVFVREWRADGFPSVKGYSTDGGRTWKPHELPFFVTGRTQAALLSDGRVICTFRSGVGRSSLWAWIGDPLDPTGFQPGGAHFNDWHSVGLKDGALHIANDGVRSQFTQYFLRSPETAESTIDVTFEVKVVSNAGRASTVSVPFVGKFRLLPDAIELAHEPAVRVRVAPGRFHTYRIARKPGLVALYVDGKLSLETNKADTRTTPIAPGVTGSMHNLIFGNEGAGDPGMNRWDADITVEMTGYRIWRRVEEILDDPTTGRKVISWSASSGRFPDQHQLDHIIEVHASAVSHDQGYSGWVQLQDGRLFVVDYTDDTAPPIRLGGGIFGVSWIRGTYVLPEDLPPRRE